MIARFEKIIDGDARQSFACRRINSPTFSAPWHFHPEYELTLIVESSGQRFIGDHIAPFKPGDLVLLGPNVPHCWLNLSSADTPAKRASAVVVQFSGDFLGEEIWDRPETRRIATLLRGRSRRGVAFAGKAASRLKERVRTLPALDSLERLLELLKVLHDLASLPRSAFTLLSSEGFVPNLNLKQMGRLERVCRFVHENYRQPIPQAQAAALAHLSNEAFSRFFRKETGRTFVGYLNDVRVSEACRLLIGEEALAVTEVCHACGFENLSNFNRHFRLRRGLAPRDYRRFYLHRANA